MISLEGLVLIAEDDPNDAYFIQRAFQKCGFRRTPHVCPDGMETIEYLEGRGTYADRRHYPFPRLLVTDLKMPRFNGFELLKWLHEHPDFMVVPTVVMTSSKDPGDVKYAYCLGANAYLTKPTSPVELEQAIRSLLEFWKWCEIPHIGQNPTCHQLSEKRV
ncbi:MAG: response regulator [Verrucomicrobiota bacterium]|jgi:CheY-like chemotaxis protein